ncbi:MAG: radical SAM/SPASM domain-containing protein [Anaerolineae bacterium]
MSALDFFAFLFRPTWDWIQVQVTSFCNAACTYCPYVVYRATWLRWHMPLTTFEKMVPDFGRARLVHLQGWGEPLLHPDFFTMVSLAKSAGCLVSTTTNGMLVDEAMARRLVASGLDVVGFSLAGTDEKNDRIRRGAPLQRVLGAIRTLQEAKAVLGSPKPAVHVAYMWLRSALEDVEHLPHLLAGLGVEEVVISTLDFVPAPDLVHEALWPAQGAAYEDLRRRLDQVVRAGEAEGIHIYPQWLVPAEEQTTCTEQVHRALVVAEDGTVAPCVYTSIPVTGATRFFGDEAHPYRPLAFGNVGRESLSDCWRKPAYAAFRQGFRRGTLLEPCRTCLKRTPGCAPAKSNTP